MVLRTLRILAFFVSPLLEADRTTKDRDEVPEFAHIKVIKGKVPTIMSLFLQDLEYV